MVFVYKKLAQFAVRCALPPRRSESPVCATDNKPSCVLHLLGWFIGSRGFSSLERRPEFWVLQEQHSSKFLWFSFCLKYAINEEADNLETPTEASKKNPHHKLSFSKTSGKVKFSKEEKF